MDEMNQLQRQYRGKEYNQTFEDKDRLLIKLLAEERNCWISGCCLALWIGVHRYRSLLKKYYRLQDEGMVISNGTGGGGNIPVAVETTVPTKPEVKKAQ